MGSAPGPQDFGGCPSAVAINIKTIYHTQFVPARNNEWLISYRDAVESAQSADKVTFRSPAFQKRLWEAEGVSGFRRAMPGYCAG